MNRRGAFASVSQLGKAAQAEHRLFANRFGRVGQRLQKQVDDRAGGIVAIDERRPAEQDLQRSGALSIVEPLPAAGDDVQRRLIGRLGPIEKRQEVGRGVGARKQGRDGPSDLGVFGQPAVAADRSDQGGAGLIGFSHELSDELQANWVGLGAGETHRLADQVEGRPPCLGVVIAGGLEHGELDRSVLGSSRQLEEPRELKRSTPAVGWQRIAEERGERRFEDVERELRTRIRIRDRCRRRSGSRAVARRCDP